MGGVNLRTVQTLLGHKDLRMTMRYSHLSPEHLREAVTTLERTLAATDKKAESMKIFPNFSLIGFINRFMEYRAFSKSYSTSR